MASFSNEEGLWDASEKTSEKAVYKSLKKSVLWQNTSGKVSENTSEKATGNVLEDSVLG